MLALLESMSAAKQCGGQHKFPAKHITRNIHENLSHHLLVPSVSWCRQFEIFLTVFIIGLIKYIERLGRRSETNKVPNHFPWCVEKIQANNLQMAFLFYFLEGIFFSRVIIRDAHVPWHAFCLRLRSTIYRIEFNGNE